MRNRQPNRATKLAAKHSVVGAQHCGAPTRQDFNRQAPHV